jgi:two-component system, OmpR family, sensor kinase
MVRTGESNDRSTSTRIESRAPTTEHSDGHPRRSALTPRQREIATLIASGLSNAAIAEQLVLTHGTVANHVATILRRLDLETRAQIVAWAVEEGINNTQSRLLTTLERLLEAEPESLSGAMNQVATHVALALGAEKVDAFLHDSATSMLVAVGTSDTPLGRKQHAIGLHRQPLADGGRTVEVFVTGKAHFDGNVQVDGEELMGVRRELGIRSQIAVPLQVGEIRQGVLVAQSTHQDYFAERDLQFVAAVSRWVGNMVHSIELAEGNRAASIEQGRRMAAEELVTVLAHDLRNYLVPICGRLDVMQRRAAREGHEQAVRDTLELRRSVDRLNHLVDDLLDLARIDQGLFDLRPARTDLSMLIREVAEGLSAPDAAIHVEVPPELPVAADSSRLRQALANLVANAVQHAPKATAVSIRASREHTDPVPSVMIVVADRGPGIDPELLPRVFDRFARSATSNGLGIGLFLARQIAEAHGGRLEVSSSSTYGTQFRMTLPERAVGHQASRSGYVQY